ncbi:unnamed protein product [Boreogadus saida]
MAQTSSGNGFKLDVPQPKGIVGKEEALRMEEEAMAKCQKEKQHSLSASSRLSSSAPSSSSHRLMASSITTHPQSSTRPERDLIVFPETKKPAESDKFSDIDVEKLTNEELEKLLLDDNFGTSSSKATRPSSLLGFNLSASYPGGHACSHSPFQTGPVDPCLYPRHPVLVSPLPPTSKPPPLPLVYQQPPSRPGNGQTFDKIASTSEYLKNGRLASMDVDSAQALPYHQPILPAAEEPTTVSRFEWLDLDPLTRRRDEAEETAGGEGGDCSRGLCWGPWDAVLETKGSRGSSSPTNEAKPPLSTQAQPRRASTGASGGAAMTRGHPISPPSTSSQQLPNNQNFMFSQKDQKVSCILSS